MHSATAPPGDFVLPMLLTALLASGAAGAESWPSGHPATGPSSGLLASTPASDSPESGESEDPQDPEASQEPEKKKRKKRSEEPEEPKRPKPKKGASANLAEGRYALGDFARADELAGLVLDARPDDFRAVHIRGRVALLRNRLDEAEAWLRRALELRPTHREAREDLAQVHYRSDRFEMAGALLAELGDEAKAAELLGFSGRRPYRVEGGALADGGSVTIPFVQTDPLPVVRVRVNGSEPVLFLIDTGAAEVYVDREWAGEIGIESVGVTKGTFGGGRSADVGHGRIDSLALGELVLRDLPVNLLDTSPFSAVAAGEEIRGVLGTVLFYHFRTTLDYPEGELRFEPRRPIDAESEQSGKRKKGGKASDKKAKKRAKDGELPPEPIHVPFWLAGDHYILARGSANDADPELFFIDTGLAGLAFTCPRSTIDDAGIELLESAVGRGVGGGGEVTIVPFLLESLSLGAARRANLPGVFGPFPERLEHSQGFRIAGILSHGFLRPWAVTFDFDAMELVLTPPGWTD